MICRRCLLRISSRNALPTIRQLSTSSAQINANTATATNPRPHGLPAATSTSAAQPFSESLTYSPENVLIEGQQRKKEVRVQSSIPAGTVLKGLNFMKNKQDPVALEDEEYPGWLWGVLEDVKSNKGRGKDEGDEGDLFGTSHQVNRSRRWALSC